MSCEKRKEDVGNCIGEYKRRRYTSWPQQAGQMNFDLNNGFEETPYQSSNKRKGKGIQKNDGSTLHYTRDQLLEMDSDSHQKLVTAELDRIYEKSTTRSSDGSAFQLMPVDVPSSAATDSSQASGHNIGELFNKCREKSGDHAEASLQIPKVDAYQHGWKHCGDAQEIFQGDKSFGAPHSKDEDSSFCPLRNSQVNDATQFPTLNSASTCGAGPSRDLLRDLETRSITVAQLIAEVKGIYAGLGMYHPPTSGFSADSIQ